MTLISIENPRKSPLWDKLSPGIFCALFGTFMGNCVGGAGVGRGGGARTIGLKAAKPVYVGGYGSKTDVGSGVEVVVGKCPETMDRTPCWP